ncbi:MAG: hypothetical protein HQL43_00450 [Alphaproteobacteria bacterium]|nr:hypothetical protein [Alphaproteobacteria bacterium]
MSKPVTSSLFENSSDFYSWLERNLAREKWAFLFFLAFTLAVTFEFYIFGSRSFLNPDSDGDSNIPARLLFANEWHEGLAGAWENHFAGGMDRMSAMFQINLLTPLFLFLPAWVIAGGVIFLSSLIACWSVYALLKRHLFVSPILAVSAAVFYLPCVRAGGLYFYDIFEVCLLPLSLLSVHHFRQNIPVNAFLQCLLAFTLGWGYGLHDIYFVGLLSFWTYFVAGLKPRHSIIVVSAHLVGWLLYLVPISAPLAEALSSSGTAILAGRSLDISFSEILSLQFIKGVYLLFVIPPIPFLVPALLALRFVRQSTEQRNVLWIALFLTLLLFFTPLISWTLHALELPFDSLRLRRMSRVVSFAAFLAIAVGAQGLGERFSIMVQDKGERLVRLSFSGLTSLLLLSLSVLTLAEIKRDHFVQFGYGASYDVLYDNPLLKSTFGQLKGDDPFRVVTASPKPFSSMVEPNHAWAYGLETADGYFAFHTAEYMNFWEAMYRMAPEPLSEPEEPGGFTKGRRFTIHNITDSCAPTQLGRHINFRFLDILNVEYLISPCPLTDEHLSLIARTDASARSVWESSTRFEKLRLFLSGRYPGKDLYIYRNTQALPRVYFATSTRAFGSQNDLLRHVAEQTETGKVARFLDAELGASGALPCSVGSATAKLVSYLPDSLTIDVDVTSCATLVIANNFHKGWQAEVDGQQAPLLRVNLLHQGLIVPKGRHHVTLKYQALSKWKIG